MHKYYYADNREFEPVKVIADWNLNFNLGCAVKYIARQGRKGDIDKDIEDLEKAIDYLEFEIETLKKSRDTFDAFEIDAFSNKRKCVLSGLYEEQHSDNKYTEGE